MPRDAATIRREYDAMPWYAQGARAADDIVRIVANGLTFGLPDYLEGEGAADRTEAARVRAGSAGTAATLAGAVRGGSLAMQGATAAPAAVRAVRAGASAAPRTAFGAGLQAAARAMAPTRRGLAAMGAGATAAGLAYAGTLDGTPAPAVRDQQAPTRQVPLSGPQRAQPPEPTTEQRRMAALDTILRSPNMTLTDLQAVTGMMPAAQQVSVKDQIMGTAAMRSDQIFQDQLTNIMAQLEAGEITQQEAQTATAQVRAEEFQRRAGLVGVNPYQLAQAQMLPIPEGEIP